MIVLFIILFCTLFIFRCLPTLLVLYGFLSCILDFILHPLTSKFTYILISLTSITLYLWCLIDKINIHLYSFYFMYHKIIYLIVYELTSMMLKYETIKIVIYIDMKRMENESILWYLILISTCSSTSMFSKLNHREKKT